MNIHFTVPCTHTDRSYTMYACHKTKGSNDAVPENRKRQATPIYSRLCISGTPTPVGVRCPYQKGTKPYKTLRISTPAPATETFQFITGTLPYPLSTLRYLRVKIFEFLGHSTKVVTPPVLPEFLGFKHSTHAITQQLQQQRKQ